MAAVTVVSENSVRRIEDEGEFNTFFRENPAAQDPILLFSLGSDVPKKLLFNLYEKYPDSRKHSQVSPLGFERCDNSKVTLDLSPSIRMLECDCQHCAQGDGNCDLERIVDMEIPTLAASKGGVQVAVAGQLRRSLTRRRSRTLPEPGANQGPAEIKLEEGRLTFRLEGSPAVSFSRKVVKLQIFIKKAGFHTFGMGILPYTAPREVPAMYIAAELQEICETWDLLLKYFKEFISVAVRYNLLPTLSSKPARELRTQLQLQNREILNKDATRDRGLIRRLVNTANVCEELCAVHQQQFGDWESLVGLIGENEDWLATSPLNLKRWSGNPAVLNTMREALERLGRSGKQISDDLVRKNDKLIERTHNLISIDEAYKSREQNASMKRLSWITFIFLPLVFVASLFGMNVDLLKNNPVWTTYFYFAAPMFILIMSAAALLNQRKLFLDIWGFLSAVLCCRATRSRGCTGDLEMQSGGQPGPVGATGDRDTFLWAAEHGSLGLLELQISRGIEIEDRSHEGRTALQLAAGCGHMLIVERLLREGAGVNAPASGSIGRTALQAAAGCGHLLIVERLLREGADVNAPATVWTGRTALQAAAEGGHMLIVERLLKEGAEVNALASSSDGRTALQAAAGVGHLPIVERLLKAGAEVNASASAWIGRTALQAAAEGGHLAIVERLLKEGAEVNAQGSHSFGVTAIEAAARSGHMAVVERLKLAGTSR